MKRILYLTFYFEPDLSAGSFRNSSLVNELAKQTAGKAEIDVITTRPNRYHTFEIKAPEFEERGNITVRRIDIPKHRNGMKDQILSFRSYFSSVRKLIQGKKYDLVFASSSRLFTAYLGMVSAKKMNAPLYLDIRDIFYDTMEDVLQNKVLKTGVLPVIKQVEKRTFSFARHINLISAGFKPYFKNYPDAIYTSFPNGIDDIFLEAAKKNGPDSDASEIKTILYAGNIGDGQGLHKIVPGAAKALEGKFRFRIIGDGGVRDLLEKELSANQITNVELLPPVKRNELINEYMKADFFFVHLNTYKAFEKVLPSKFFELAAFSKPIIAGVGGYAAEFVENNIENSILFEPCNVTELVQKLSNYEYKLTNREDFISKFKRETINREMAKSIVAYL